MSETRMRALRPLIDARTADYIDAALAHTTQTLARREVGARTQITQLEDQVRALRDEVAALRAEVNDARYEDRFALTRAKLIRLMKEIGIED